MANTMKPPGPRGPKGPTGPNPLKGLRTGAGKPPPAAGGRNKVIRGAPYMADPNAIPGPSGGSGGIPFRKGGMTGKKGR